jgi:hypothetical protein
MSDLSPEGSPGYESKSILRHPTLWFSNPFKGLFLPENVKELCDKSSTKEEIISHLNSYSSFCLRKDEENSQVSLEVDEYFIQLKSAIDELKGISEVSKIKELLDESHSGYKLKDSNIIDLVRKCSSIINDYIDNSEAELNKKLAEYYTNFGRDLLQDKVIKETLPLQVPPIDPQSKLLIDECEHLNSISRSTHTSIVIEIKVITILMGESNPLNLIDEKILDNCVGKPDVQKDKLQSYVRFLMGGSHPDKTSNPELHELYYKYSSLSTFLKKHSDEDIDILLQSSLNTRKQERNAAIISSLNAFDKNISRLRQFVNETEATISLAAKGLFGLSENDIQKITAKNDTITEDMIWFDVSQQKVIAFEKEIENHKSNESTLNEFLAEKTEVVAYKIYQGKLFASTIELTKYEFRSIFLRKSHLISEEIAKRIDDQSSFKHIGFLIGCDSQPKLSEDPIKRSIVEDVALDLSKLQYKKPPFMLSDLKLSSLDDTSFFFHSLIVNDAAVLEMSFDKGFFLRDSRNTSAHKTVIRNITSFLELIENAGLKSIYLSGYVLFRDKDGFPSVITLDDNLEVSKISLAGPNDFSIAIGEKINRALGPLQLIAALRRELKDIKSFDSEGQSIVLKNGMKIIRTAKSLNSLRTAMIYDDEKYDYQIENIPGLPNTVRRTLSKTDLEKDGYKMTSSDLRLVSNLIDLLSVCDENKNQTVNIALRIIKRELYQPTYLLRFIGTTAQLSITTGNKTLTMVNRYNARIELQQDDGTKISYSFKRIGDHAKPTKTIIQENESFARELPGFSVIEQLKEIKRLALKKMKDRSKIIINPTLSITYARTEPNSDPIIMITGFLKSPTPIDDIMIKAQFIESAKTPILSRLLQISEALKKIK